MRIHKSPTRFEDFKRVRRAAHRAQGQGFRARRDGPRPRPPDRLTGRPPQTKIKIIVEVAIALFVLENILVVKLFRRRAQ